MADDQSPLDRVETPDSPNAPGLDHVEDWIFDLDNTLYPATSSLFPQIDLRMKEFIAKFLKVEPHAAFEIQKRYYHEFGTTLRGLMLNHGLEPDEFLAYVHDVDHSVLEPSAALDAALQALPGRKLIFTNGSERHAEAVLARLKLDHHFTGIYDIRAADFIPKPQPPTYQAMLKAFGVRAEASAFFEDSAANLKPAAEIGMTTVWVRPHDVQWFRHTHDLGFIHHITDDLVAWLEAAGRVLRKPQ
ncbi:pyrimidine 5'-nucleotidase [Caenispirillum bisanense]|uniref:Putative hydrolase of the HAD superfamily n=1 Tax=Caenispirillum bisanense TaxID=414052 RepID=A0A286GTX9_9PROT|nr:pyrimidine 5'-nucleotidase [Caenispirillum bisanense]SOD98636.1 putative hydrolase of the HAD superfamily [Caenispirillum bisanense]